ncbi:MAG: phosphoribosylaminoimidazolesuccinocarboxamide synthase [Pseudanabaena sp.]|jgi:phosphoribosylaminoimidazole-succinocarboxamide synthase|uniref:phosphoribosylaminoimidazolesuccinocarboxamide synthase n=1 Tax=Pseudanabaena mucicola TaxID=71190 RepID=UPI0025786477|nr:phosphoribosylaminoimidazolesuccinocarboxamide synthase [Pseudanabaena mucicola]MCA6575383.1 phosphoribosylaminoimidazolesuccinocarboxamide synthase [Pseudanabaena sp. M53BS1SP1A06MG]MCA6582366.1 phosphoribosylaminoimidazolesuccinocarboxamide synthase [Pseudanabaena sp. M34BS1SP1A06MG]MCA6586081.1 phosphoribosylaminoimidazolesuccinocarboxamide synthase [Pseudanabaena sp. M051S1SP1A06QC]MCA6591517.1 phosphoribosylaminoimidazolesuccinocarboxamide synthase [Pseudanabaena sp. M38BS1SP1A06MG]MCA
MSGTKLYEGKAKILFTTDDPDILLSLYKDDATAFNALKKGTIANKGQINCAIASHIFQYLETKGIATHFIKQISPNEMQVAAVKILPIEVVVRNIAAGSICKRLGLEQGQPLKQPLVEFFYKNDELGDPLITDAHVAMLDLATPKQVEDLKQIALSINQHLQAFFEQCNLILVDFKVEIGVNSSGKMLLADEISPDTCRLWDKAIVDPTARILDKDRFRQDLGNVAEAYHEVLRRVLATQAVAI